MNSRLLWMVGALVITSGCSSTDAPDGSVVPCVGNRMPQDGERCDPAELPAGKVCRFASCEGDCGDECTCGADARWSCAPGSCRDYGGHGFEYDCGTPPLCVANPTDCRVVSSPDAG